jgi:hypothetical protein
MQHQTYHGFHCSSFTLINRLTNHPNIPTIPIQVTLIVWGSMPLITMSMTHDSSTLYRRCTHSPWVTIILGIKAPVDPTEYLYTLLWCALGYHYKAFQYLLLVCSAPGEVSPEVLVQNHQGPPFVPCGSQESPLTYPLVPNQVNP